MMNIDTCD